MLIPEGPWRCLALLGPSKELGVVEATEVRIFWLKRFPLTSTLMVPDSVRTLQGPRGHWGRRGQNLFMAEKVPFNLSLDSWWDLMVSSGVWRLLRPRVLLKISKKAPMPLQNNYRGQSNYHSGYHSSGGNRRPFKSHRGQHHLPNQPNTQNANQEVAKEWSTQIKEVLDTTCQ